MVSSRSALGMGAVGLVGLGLLARSPLRSWGATAEERDRALPGDGLIPGERDVTTMATTIQAPPAAVWPWLVQMGHDRAGWYSWDLLDNMGHPSATEINPAWQRIEEGDRFFSTPDRRAWFAVAQVEPERSLVLRASMDLRGRSFDPATGRPRAFTDGRWEFFLDGRPDGSTRLIVRGGGTGGPRPLPALANLLFWGPAHVIMQVRQFQQLRRRAEARRATSGAPEPRAGRGVVTA